MDGHVSIHKHFAPSTAVHIVVVPIDAVWEPVDLFYLLDYIYRSYGFSMIPISLTISPTSEALRWRCPRGEAKVPLPGLVVEASRLWAVQCF